MKVIKQICLDPILASKLVDINASQLITELLDDYFNKLNPTSKTLTTQPLQEKIKELQTQQTDIDKQIKHNKLVESIDIDPLIKEWFAKIDTKPSFNSLVAFLDAHQLPRKDCMSLLNAWEIIHDEDSKPTINHA